jgi:hypothetical protein
MVASFKGKRFAKSAAQTMRRISKNANGTPSPEEVQKMISSNGNKIKTEIGGRSIAPQIGSSLVEGDACPKRTAPQA